jgi:hypothetical protein
MTLSYGIGIRNGLHRGDVGLERSEVLRRSSSSRLLRKYLAMLWSGPIHHRVHDDDLEQVERVEQHVIAMDQRPVCIVDPV